MCGGTFFLLPARQTQTKKAVLASVTYYILGFYHLSSKTCQSETVQISCISILDYRQCAGTVKRLGLELGGNAAFIVFESADLDLAVSGCMASKFRNAGQTCVSTNRVLVQDSVAEEFTEKLRVAMEQQLVLGDPTQPGVTIGPLINQSQHSKVCDMVSSSVKAGAQVVMGGQASDVSPLHYQPTILTNVTEDMVVFQEEIFGPVISLAKFSSEEEALTIANNSRTGLASYFYSNNMAQCWRVGKKLQTGWILAAKKQFYKS